MTSRVRVRFIPKTKDAESITMDLMEITPQNAKRFSPDPNRASEALKSAFSMGLEAKISPKNNSVEGIVPLDRFNKLFQTDLREVEVKKNGGYTHDRSMRTEKFLVPTEEIVVPDSMKETIAFAYVPTPPEYFGISFIPPSVSNYHLRLSDVLHSLKGGQCHRRGWTGRGIKIAMADSGFANHPYFEVQGYKIVRVHTPETDNPLIDIVGHGTGESANALIIAPDCHFIGVKQDDYAALALQTSLSQNPHIITNSWGWDIDNISKEDLKASDPNFFNEMRDIENIINDAISDGVVAIFSAGNGHKAFPASIPSVIAVGGTTIEENGDIKASSYASSFTSQLYPGRVVPDFCGVVGEFSNSGPMKGHIMLPVPEGSKLEGENMNGLKRGWGIFSGTSAAAPQAAGITALLLSVNPNLKPADIKSIISSKAKDVVCGVSALGDEAMVGYDKATGAGFMDAYAACLLAESLLQ